MLASGKSVENEEVIEVKAPESQSNTNWLR